MGFPDDIRNLLRRRDPLSNITGFAGGNLRDQLDRQPNEESLKFLRSPEEKSPLASPEALTRSRTDLSNKGEPQVKPYNYGANPTDVLRQEYGAWQNYKPQKEGNRFLSALKSAGMAIRANARPGMSPGEIIGAGIGGATVGGITDKPGYYKKDWEMNRAGSQYADALQLQRMQSAVDQEPLRTKLLQSQVDENLAQADKLKKAPDPQVEAERDNLRQTWANILASGQDFSEDNPQHKELADRAKKLGLTLPYGKKAGKDLVEVEIDGQKLQVTPGEALNYYGQIGKESRTTEQKQQDKYDEKLSKWEESETKRQADLGAAQDELTSLEIEEKAALANKNAASAEVARLKELAKDKESGVFQADITFAQQNERDAQKDYASYADKKRAAQAKARRLSTGTPKPQARSSGYSGRTMSKANLSRYAKDNGLTEEEARRQVEGKGITVH